MPLVDAIADLVDQVGYAYREYYNTRGYIRRHIVPVSFFMNLKYKVSDCMNLNKKSHLKTSVWLFFGDKLAYGRF